MKLYSPKIKESNLIHLTSIILTLFYNIALFRNFFTDYPLNIITVIYAISLVLIIFLLIDIILTLLCFRFTIKPILISILLISSITSYFMNTYNVVIDASMIQNAFATNTNEALDLFNIKLLAYLLILGIFPSYFVYRVPILHQPLHKTIYTKIKITLLAIVVIISQLLIFGKFYSSFFREHKSIRYYTNPVISMYSSFKFINKKFNIDSKTLIHIGHDSKISKSDIERELVIFVIGETARADRFSLNGYTKQTNPLLESEGVYSFTNVTSCGTSTAISVPCIFSHINADQFDESTAHNTENILDILQSTGVNVLWRDNNSDSKHVALRVPFEDFRTTDKNPVCDIECRDVGMLSGLSDYIEKKKEGDILIVLHQMGNHGPAYFKRYPKDFEKFKPTCKTKQLEDCSLTEIGNTYDNAILYTDYFLSQTIQLLKKYDDEFETSMIYISDHGESLGENGIFLHGLPDFMAPTAQKHVGAIFWFGENFEDVNYNVLSLKKSTPFSHDNFFHTLLGIFEVESNIYNKEKDMIGYIKDHQH